MGWNGRPAGISLTNNSGCSGCRKSTADRDLLIESVVPLPPFILHLDHCSNIARQRMVGCYGSPNFHDDWGLGNLTVRYS